MKYRLLALDLDGTLLNSRQEITPRTLAALAAARERGVQIVIATGRSPQSALAWSRTAGGGPVICCNGAAVLDESGEVLIQRPLPVPLIQRVLELAAGTGLLMECYTTRGIVLERPWAQAGEYFRWVRPKRSWLSALKGLFRLWWINRVQPVPSLRSWISRPGRPPVLKLMALGRRPELDRLADALRREMPQVEVSSSSPDNLEVTAAGVNKATALELLASRLKVPREAVMAVGDSSNDLAMLHYAGTGVAMGNAARQVQAAADRVTSTNDAEGVAALVEEMCRT